MSLLDRKRELQELVLAAIKGVILRLNMQHEDKNVYSLVIYPSSGYRDIGIAYFTRSGLQNKATEQGEPLDPDVLEMLKDHPDLLQRASTETKSESYYEVNACEWDGASSNSDLFCDVNYIIDEEYDALYDEGIENAEICEFFESMLTDVLLQVKSQGMLQGRAFADDVLLGVQFPDASNVDMVIRISEAVNSPAWHEKLCAGYG